MIKNLKYVIGGVLLSLMACSDNNYLEGLYIEPVASFSLEKSEFQVLETIKFTNTGKGTTFVVWPGNTGHRYGVQGDTGFASGSDGVFTYSYDEPGEYEVVWIASSVDAEKKIVSKTVSRKITVVDKNGGLDKFTISNICKMTEYTGTVYYNSAGEYISPDTLMCPVLWAAWKDAKVNTIKTSNQLITFYLTSSTAKMYWYDKSQDQNRLITSGNSASRFVGFMDGDRLGVQKFVVETSSGFTTNYYVAPVIIPAFTSFGIGSAEATIKRNIAFYDRYDVTITVPSGTDLTKAVPVFKVMNDDPNLLDGTNCKVTLDGAVQTSGITQVDLSGGDAVYTIEYRMMGENNTSLTQKSQMHIKVIKQ